MSRYADLAAQPPQPTIEGDAASSKFIGLDMKTDRDKLATGMYARGENKRCHRGIVEDRPGVATPVFANIEAQTIIGSGVYSNPNGEEVQLIATPADVRVIKSGSYPLTVPIPEGVTLSGKVTFAQHFNVILLHQEEERPTLVWDGIAPAFTEIEKSNADDTSTVVMPNPPWSVNFGYRAFFPTGADTLGASDELDYTSIDLALHNFRINTGEASAIVAVHPFQQSRLIVGNTRSIDLLTGVIGDLGNATMEVLNDDVNFAALRGAALVGGELFFLASKPRGVYRITEIVQDKLETAAVPVSDPVEPLLARINWGAIAGAIMVTDGIYLKLFVPMDDSEVNNACLVYNTVNKAWVGWDYWDLDAIFQVDNAYIADYYGQKACYAVNHSANLIHVMEKGIEDELGLTFDPDTGYPIHTNFPIRTIFESRGYATLGWNAATTRDFKRVEIAAMTLRPSLTVTELGSGAGDERPLHFSPITEDPTKYTTFGKNDWNPTNANNDFNTPGREDYSMDWGSEFSLPAEAGLDIELKQRTPLPFSTKAQGEFMSYRIENTEGRADVAGLIVESAGVGQIRRGG